MTDFPNKIHGETMNCSKVNHVIAMSQKSTKYEKRFEEDRKRSINFKPVVFY